MIGGELVRTVFNSNEHLAEVSMHQATNSVICPTRPGSFRATEHKGVMDALKEVVLARQYGAALIGRLSQVRPVRPGENILEVGCASGALLHALSEMGFECSGVDVSPVAVQTATELMDHVRTRPRISGARAEALPFQSRSFDVVIARSLMEHVSDPVSVVSEAFRVLRPGGIFWFQTASAMCPFQNEIARFPLFGWYPLSWKRRLMTWAVSHAPGLIGHTTTPAIHWFSDKTAARLLSEAGFGEIRDRWDLRGQSEGGASYRKCLRLIQRYRVARVIANSIVSTCSYCGIKP